jgi:hypothetical protein
MCIKGVIRTVARTLPFGAIGLGASLFGGGKGGKTKNVTNNYAVNPRGSFTDAAGNLVFPPGTGHAAQGTSSTVKLAPPSTAQPSLFAKRG